MNEREKQVADCVALTLGLRKKEQRDLRIFFQVSQLSSEGRPGKEEGSRPSSEINSRLTEAFPMLCLMKAWCTKCSKMRTQTFPPLKVKREVPGSLLANFKMTRENVAGPEIIGKIYIWFIESREDFCHAFGALGKGLHFIWGRISHSGFLTMCSGPTFSNIWRFLSRPTYVCEHTQHSCTHTHEHTRTHSLDKTCLYIYYLKTLESNRKWKDTGESRYVEEGNGSVEFPDFIVLRLRRALICTRQSG